MNGTMIDGVPLFASLSDEQRALIWKRMALETRRAGEPIFVQGDPATAMYVIKSGWVRLVSDRVHILANISQGSLVGDADVLLGHTYGTGAEAISAVEVWTLTLDDLVAIVAEDPRIGLELSKAFGASVTPLIRYLVDRRLRPLPGLAEVPEPILLALAGQLGIRLAEPGEGLYTAGQAPTSLYLIEMGRVSVTMAGSQVSEYEVGDLVGEPDFFAGRPHATTAKALEPSWLWELSAADLEQLSAVYPDIRSLLSGAARSRLSAADLARATALLQATPIFSTVPPAVLKELASRMSMQVVPSGTRLFEADTPARAMYIVESGTVALLNQRNEPLARVGAGGYVGETGLIDGGTYGIAAQTKGSTALWVLRAEDVQKVAERFPVIQQVLLTEVAAEKASTEEHFAERYLRHLDLFSGLQPDQIRDVAQLLRPQHFKASEAVYRRGAVGSALYLIQQGQVSLQTRTAEGVMHVLASLSAGEFFGETSLLTGDSHTADAFALTEVDAWALTREDFESLLVRYPSIAINLSRVLSRRLRQSDEQMVSATRAVPAPVAVWEPARREPAPGTVQLPAQAPVQAAAAAPAAPQAAPGTAAAPTGALTGLNRAANAAATWFGAQSTGNKLRLVAVILLIIWLLGVAAPSLVISLLSGNSAQNTRNVQSSLVGPSALLAMASQDLPEGVAPTYTPWPTDTPIPSPTPTATATPTNTPLPTPTFTPMPTQTPVPQPTARPAEVAPAAAAAPAPTAAPTATPKPAQQYELVEFKHLTGCENGWNHVAKVHVVDANGNPLDGVMIVFRAAGMGSIFDVKASGVKGPGWVEFDLHKDGQYMVYPSEDKSNPIVADVVSPPIGTVRAPDGSIWPEEKCNGNNGNTMGHNSFNIIFRKNF